MAGCDVNLTAIRPRKPDAVDHHDSHRGLIHEVPVGPRVRAPVDAVIVPAARPIGWLRDAVRLASELDATLVAMCSKSVRSHEVRSLAPPVRLRTVAVDVARGSGLLPALATDDLLKDSEYDCETDTSTKRNLALLLCRMVGWRRVLFLDDDIVGVNASDALSAAALLKTNSEHWGYDAVGLRNIGFPDNSVVCHANRALGSNQAEFVGAGALAVAPLQTTSFFPSIYNEDWFFLLGISRPPRVAVTGSMQQRQYDPFADPIRARREEFGDCMAEGIYRLLDQQLPLDNVTIEYWRWFIKKRKKFIGRLLARTRSRARSIENWSSYVASLEAAHDVVKDIDPRLCAEYFERWHTDLLIWRRFLSWVRTNIGVDEALDILRLVEPPSIRPILERGLQGTVNVY